MPFTAEKETVLSRTVELLLSFDATAVNAPTEVPVYTARTVSKADPSVRRVQMPELGAVNAHQTDFAAEFPACAGSLVSEVPSVLFPVSVQVAVEVATAVAKESFAGRTGVGVVAPRIALARLRRPPDFVLPARAGILSVPLSNRVMIAL